MKIIASVAISSDGYLDDTSEQRLVLSDQADWQEVYALRAKCDAILVGAETLRKDNPALILRDDVLRAERIKEGKPADIIKVVVSSECNLSPNMRFFTDGDDAQKIVITTEAAPSEQILALSPFATIIILPFISACGIAESLSKEGVEQLLVEGGARTLKLFIDENMLDEMRLASSPIIVCDKNAPRLPYFQQLPFENSCTFKRKRQLGIMTVCDYIIKNELSITDKKYIQRAIDLSLLSPPCATAYRVGCVIITSSGATYEGYTHETGPSNHAEEEVLKKCLADGADLIGATAYTSMEPCSKRKSKPVSCSELMINHRVSKVVFAYSEPNCFVHCEGRQIMLDAGIEVIEAKEYSQQVIDINSHIIK